MFAARFRGMGRTTSARAAAVRRAQEAKQSRDAKRLTQERAVEQALADFYEHTGRAAQLRETAARRAAQVIADAEEAASVPDRLAAAAVVRLHQLGETRAAIVELTGISSGEVRDALGAGANDAAA